MIQDGEDADDARRADAPNFGMVRSVGVLKGDMTTFVAKAGAQNGDPIANVEFTWAVKDPVVATVDDGVIEGVSRGTTEVTVSVVGRGISVKLPVTVHDPVKGIVAMTDDLTAVEVGGTIMVTAKAYDAANDDDGMNDGNRVPGVTLTWMSSNTAVATVDSKGKVTAKGSGTADITAHFGDVASNKIGVTVFSLVEPQRRILVNTSTAPFTRYLDNDANDDDTADDPVLTASADTTDNSVAYITITVNLQYWGLDSENELDWLPAADGLAIKLSSTDVSILTVPEMIVTAGGSGAVTLTINAGTAVEGQGNALKAGKAVVTFDEDYSSAQRVQVTFTAKAGSGG